jgi:hypothetical protein
MPCSLDATIVSDYLQGFGDRGNCDSRPFANGAKGWGTRAKMKYRSDFLEVDEDNEEEPASEPEKTAKDTQSSPSEL